MLGQNVIILGRQWDRHQRDLIGLGLADKIGETNLNQFGSIQKLSITAAPSSRWSLVPYSRLIGSGVIIAGPVSLNMGPLSFNVGRGLFFC